MEIKKFGPKGKPYTIKSDLEFLYKRIYGIECEVRVILDQEMPSIVSDYNKFIDYAECENADQHIKEQKELFYSLYYRWNQLQPAWGYIEKLNKETYDNLQEFFESYNEEYFGINKD